MYSHKLRKYKEHSLLEIRKFREFHSNIKESQGYIYPSHKTYRFIIYVSPTCLFLFSYFPSQVSAALIKQNTFALRLA